MQDINLQIDRINSCSKPELTNLLQQEMQMIQTISTTRNIITPLSLPSMNIENNVSQFIFGKANIYMAEESKPHIEHTIEINNAGIKADKYQCCNIM